MGYKGYIISASTDIDNPMGIYRDIPSWQTDEPIHKTQDEASAKVWIDAQYTLAKLGESLKPEEIKFSGVMKEVPLQQPGFKSTPVEEADLRRQLQSRFDEDVDGSKEMMAMSEDAYNMGRPDIAEKLKRIAEDEWKHFLVMKEILEGLEP